MDRRTKSNIFQSNRKIVHLSSDWKIRWALSKHSAVDFITSSGMKSSFYCICAQTELDNRRSVTTSILRAFSCPIDNALQSELLEYATRGSYPRLDGHLFWVLLVLFRAKERLNGSPTWKLYLPHFFVYIVYSHHKHPKYLGRELNLVLM